ncbi:MAG: prenyltransferase/squalene oxidase repeat-containing protein [Planctomycetota bacterium]
MLIQLLDRQNMPPRNSRQPLPHFLSSVVTSAKCVLAILGFWASLAFGSVAWTQPPQRESAFLGQAVPRDVREIYERGLGWLEKNQDETGRWRASGGESGPGVTGLATMAFLAYGEDPNYGAYSTNVRRGIRAIIEDQNGTTGYIGTSMYHHGFAMLALAEAYGTVDERNLWEGSDTPENRRRSIGKALELAVRTAITSQNKNNTGGWRYSPDSTDADTSVTGSVLVGLLAARNAGIEVPDKVVDRAIKYFTEMTSPSGQVAYAGGLGGFDNSPARVSIATLSYSIAGRKDLKEFKSASSFLVSSDSSETSDHYGEYTAYYKAQALFQADIAAWEKWNRNLVRELKEKQRSDGHFDGNYGAPVATSMSLLALALNFRFLPIYER